MREPMRCVSVLSGAVSPVFSCLLACLLFGLSGCAVTVTRDGLGPMGAPEAVITAAVFAERGTTPTFTVQGTLEQGGQPVTDTVPVIATITDADTGAALSTSPVLVLVAQGGRFMVEVPLPDAKELAAAGELEIELRDAGTSVAIGGPLAVAYSPRAWAAEYARSAGHAETAAQADFADAAGHAASADVADALSGNNSVLLTPELGWEHFGLGYGDLRATRVGDMVFLSGLARYLDTIGAGNTIAVLPAGFRPDGQHILSTISNTTINRIDVLPNGEIRATINGGNTFISLSGLAFPTGD